jgi:hypothetical protein
MIRWIAFDDETAEAVVSKFKRGGAEIYRGEPLDAVLDFGKPSLMLLPSTKSGRVLLAQFQPRARSAAIESREPIAFETMGFLGLTDQPVYSNHPADEDIKNKKKRWWQRRSA